jgi:hypothetical protein
VLILGGALRREVGGLLVAIEDAVDSSGKTDGLMLLSEEAMKAQNAST